MPRKGSPKTRYPDISWRYLDGFSEEEMLGVLEEDLQPCVVAYIQEIYPDALFCANVASNVKLGWQKARRQKKAGNKRAWPDLFIAVPVNGYHGLFIELKKFELELRVKSSAHVNEQCALLNKLESLGYYARMTVGWKDTKRVIDEYLKGKYFNE